MVFTHPSYPDWTLVKRVIGLPGERITVAGGQIHVDDRRAGRAVGRRADALGFARSGAPDSLWVLADRRAVSSVDSRVLGPIPIEDVGWIVVARYWPPRRASRI